MSSSLHPTRQGQVDRATASAEAIIAELSGLDDRSNPFVGAVRTTRMPMIITNPRQPDNPVVFTNDAFCRLSGYSREEIVGRNCRFLQGDDTDPAAIAAISAAVRAVQPIEIDILNHRKDGERFWNRLLLAPVFDAEGRLTYFFASQVDVTLERQRLQGLETDNAALTAELTDRLRSQQEREREMTFAMRAGRFGTWSLELPTRMMTASPACKELFGRTADAPFTYADRVAAIVPEDRPSVEEALQRIERGGGDYEVTFRVRRPDGEIRWLTSRAQTFTDAKGRLLRMSGVSRDVTVERRSEEMRAALVRLGDVFSGQEDPDEVGFAVSQLLGETLVVSRVGYGVIDTGTETITIERDWNAKGTTTLAGVLRFRDFGTYIDDLKRGETAVVSDARLDPRTQSTASALEAISARSFVNMPVTEQGGLVALLYLNHESARQWPQEELTFLREVAERTRAAIERRRAEKALAALAASLETQVRERTQALMEAEEALRQSQKLEAVGQLTGGVAHDFNNLLTIIRSSVDFLKREDLPAPRRARYVEAISDTVKRASKLTSQLLAFARRQPLKPQVFDVSARVQDVSDLIQPLVGARIVIQVEPCASPCYTEADVSQFETALVNLAVNARDAMDGEGRLVFSVRGVHAVPPIRGHTGASGNFITVSVADTGRGIAASEISSIFEPFYTTKEVGKGTGLGLSQVFGFTKQSGGEVDVSSELGRGSVFTLYLPQVVSAPAHPAVIADDPTPVAPPQSLRLLVVEDNEVVGRFADEMLRDLGYQTHLVGNAREALCALEPEDAGFDLVFSDVIMPGMNGVDLAREIRRRWPELPVVLTSGYSNVLAQEGTHGFDLLRKPYSIDELARRLRSLAEHR